MSAERTYGLGTRSAGQAVLGPPPRAEDCPPGLRTQAKAGLCRAVLAALLLHPISSPGDQSALARLYCLSLQFQHASDSTTEYSLDLQNSELWPYDPSSYAATITLSDDWLGGSFPGYMKLPIPPPEDADGDGFDDFFESTQPVNAVATSAPTVSAASARAP